MFLSLYLTAWLSALSLAIERPYYHTDRAEEYFEEYITTHGRSYQRGEEMQMRLEIFKKNLIEINHLNTYNGSIYGVTLFTDLTKEEHSCVPPEAGLERSSCRVITDADIRTNQAPVTLDYRMMNAVTPVRNQGSCKSCWAFASVGSLEGLYAMKYRELLSLSPQQLMDCLPSSQHCHLGGNFMTNALLDLIQQPGVESESDYPYVGRDLACQLQAAKARVRVTGCFNFRLTTEEKLKETLFQYGPIAIAINSSPLQQQWSGIVDAATCPPEPLGHAVLLVGYGNEAGKDFWLIKNSWGTNWGNEQGYFRLARGYNVCGMLNNLAASGNIA